MGRFVTPLVVSWTSEAEKYVLHEPLIFQSSLINARLLVEAGFETDLASVPRWARSIVGKGDLSAKAAVVHDALYVWRPCARRLADAIMFEASLAAGEPAWRAFIMWSAVRVGGAKPWRETEYPHYADIQLLKWLPLQPRAPVLREWGEHVSTASGRRNGR